MAINSKFQIPTARDVWKSIPNAKQNWAAMNPMQKWCYFYSFGKIPFDFVRIPLFKENQRDVHWFAYFVFACMSIIESLMAYTMVYYQYHGELQSSLASTCIASVMIGHFPIASAMVSKMRFKLQSLIDFGGKYIYRNSRVNNEYNRICSQHMDITMRKFIIKMGCIFMSYLFACIGPTYAYIVHGTKTTTTEMHVPFCEPKSTTEFLLNLLLQTIVAGHGIIMYVGLEVFQAILENVVTIAPQVVEAEIDTTIQLYEDKSITELELRWRIIRIVELSLDADNYVSNLSDLLFWRNLFTPVAFTYSIGMSIFCQYAMGYAAGYGIAGMSWVQLFFVCELGENIQDNGFDDLLYQTKWEILPLKYQKIIMMLIHRKQQERGLKMGPFGAGICRENFKLLTNKIYTFIMFLLNFFS